MNIRALHTAFALLVVVLCCLSCGGGTEERGEAADATPPTHAASDTSYQNLLLTYLREHFDDIHDVTMRYHHRDHTINGQVAIKMTWENEVLKSAEVVSNETGSDELPGSLIEKMEAWKIAGLDGPAEMVLPFNVKLVGLDDPAFPNTGILTGEVADERGAPIWDALVLIKPEVAGQVYRARTNREGIFVTTLIPPGTWDLECSHLGYETAARPGLKLKAGDHKREEFVLKSK